MDTKNKNFLTSTELHGFTFHIDQQTQKIFVFLFSLCVIFVFFSLYQVTLFSYFFSKAGSS
jgi:hypothetical protein